MVNNNNEYSSPSFMSQRGIQTMNKKYHSTLLEMVGSSKMENINKRKNLAFVATA
jgi:hypothetical protein